jgi:Zn-dependent protease
MNFKRFTWEELAHLAGSVAALTVGFAFVSAGNGFDVGAKWQILQDQPILWIASFIAVTSGFIFHELAHKIVAITYGYWAEFRSEPKGLGLSLLVAIFTGFLFAAPGAVIIHGRPTLKENGVISIVGPAANILLALVALPFTVATNQDAALPTIMGAVALVNAVLALFNLVPFSNLDGRKIFHWSKLIWAIGFVLALILTILTLFPILNT